MIYDSKNAFSIARRQNGVALIEALVAFLIMALGILSLTQVQSMLRLNADVSRQRSEALRIAQRDIENLRSYSQLAGYNAIAGQSATNITGLTTNTTFQLSRVIVENADPAYKRVNVSVNWTDRQGSPQSVSLNTLVARLDPANAGQLAIPPEGSPTKNPLDRNVKIPVTATNLGGGKSGYAPPGQNFYFVFNNSNADIIEKCTGALSQSSYDAIKAGDSSAGSCDSNKKGYLVSGFVNFDLRNNISATAPGTSTCEFYQDLASTGLIAGSMPTLNVFSLNFLPGQSFGYANAVTVASSSALIDGQTGVGISSNLVVLLRGGNDVEPNSAVFEPGGASIVLRTVAGVTVESYARASGSNVNNANGSVAGSAVINNTGGLSINPGVDLQPSTSYQLVIPAGVIRLERTTGNAKYNELNAQIIINFTTGLPPLVLTSSTPADNASGVAANANVNMVFSDNIVLQSGSLILYIVKNNGTGQVVETFTLPGTTGGGGGTLSITGNTLTINPGADFQTNEQYYITISAGAIKGVGGGVYPGISNSTDLNFYVTAGSASSCSMAYPFMTADVISTDASRECYSDDTVAVTSSTARAVNYTCAVYPNNSTTLLWNGSIQLKGPAGWLVGDNSQYKVCRYYDADGDGFVPNEQHPASYTNVNTTLVAQNFLVIKKNKSCPSEVVNIGSQTGETVHYKTTEFQP